MRCLSCGWQGTGAHDCQHDAQRLAGVAAHDQTLADVRAFAEATALHFRTLREGGLPDGLAAILTQQYHAVVLQRPPS